MRSIFLLLPLLGVFQCGGIAAVDSEGPVRIAGSSVISRPVSLAIPILNDRGVIAKLLPEAGSTASIDAVGSGDADIAISARPLSGEDKAPYPKLIFHEQVIGYQALALVVSKDVWNSGVRALTKEQMRQIYEQDVTNWKQLGGEDREIKYYNPQDGDGVWEFFVTWLYGEIRKAPLGDRFEQVKGGREASDMVAFANGAISVLPVMYVDNKNAFGLAVPGAKGELMEPTLKNVFDKKYPIQRPLMLIEGATPVGNIRQVVEFMTSSEGQALLKKSEFVPLPSP